MKYRVEKQDYSRGAWRVLDAETGEQVWRHEVFDHPNMGRIPISGPVCFERKRDAVAWVAAHVCDHPAGGIDVDEVEQCVSCGAVLGPARA